jgi:hypothetical protein
LKTAERERGNLTGSKVEAETYLMQKRYQEIQNTLYQASDNISDFDERSDESNGKYSHEKSK